MFYSLRVIRRVKGRLYLGYGVGLTPVKVLRHRGRETKHPSQVYRNQKGKGSIHADEGFHFPCRVLAHHDIHLSTYEFSSFPSLNGPLAVLGFLIHGQWSTPSLCGECCGRLKHLTEPVMEYTDWHVGICSVPSSVRSTGHESGEKLGETRLIDADF